MLHQRHSLFPLVLASLTLGLVILMFYSFTGWNEGARSVVQEPAPISSQEYERDMEKITNSFVQAYNEQTDDLGRLVQAEKTMQELLVLRVPSDQKDFHLSLVVQLNRVQQALRDRTGAEEVFLQFQQLLRPL